ECALDGRTADDRKSVPRRCRKAWRNGERRAGGQVDATQNIQLIEPAPGRGAVQLGHEGRAGVEQDISAPEDRGAGTAWTDGSGCSDGLHRTRPSEDCAAVYRGGTARQCAVDEQSSAIHHGGAVVIGSVAGENEGARPRFDQTSEGN